MLKFTEASKARDRVADIERSLRFSQDELIQLCNQLFALRTGVGRVLVADFEHFASTLSSKPEACNVSQERYRVNQLHFDLLAKSFSESLTDDIRGAAVIGSATLGLGSAAGAATAFAAPTAAIAIATTFGTASTGTAISALSGVAATNAALAWLGGGALAAGGSGIAGGNALLALAGPVGLALAGTSVIAGIGWAAYKNRDTIDEANKVHRQFQHAFESVQQRFTQVSCLYGLTVEQTHSLRQLLKIFIADAPQDCLLFSVRQKKMFEIMHNHVFALGQLLILKPEEVKDWIAPVHEVETPVDQIGETRANITTVVNDLHTIPTPTEVATSFLLTLVGKPP